MWRESSTDCHGTENGWDCGLCSRFGRAAHQRLARRLSRYGWGRKPCSLCEEVDLELLCSNMSWSGTWIGVYSWNWCAWQTIARDVQFVCTFWNDCFVMCVYTYVCNCSPFWVNNNELLNQNGIIHNGWPALTECCKWLYQPSWIWSYEDTEWVMELHAVIGNCLVLRKWQVIGQYLSYSCWT